MKVIITGTTGMVGKGILLECLDEAIVSEVLSISRKDIGIEHSKLKQILHADFSEFDSIQDELVGYDACFACMGVSSAGMKEDMYTNFTFDFTIALASILHKINPKMTFNYVSGVGTDSSENGRVMWARVKGRTENAILNMGFEQAYMFRPGAIIPKRGVQPSSKLYRILINNMKWFIRLLKLLSPNSVIDTDQIGRAMLYVVDKSHGKQILLPKDILELSIKE